MTPARRRSVAVGAALFAAALGLRVWGLSFGLPHFFSGDEIEKTEIALHLPDTGFSHWEGQPSLLVNSLFVVYAVAGGLRDDLLIWDFQYLGRLWMAILGSLAVVVVWRLGARFEGAGRGAGLAAAVLLAVMPLHSTASRYIKEDAPLALMAALALLAVVRWLEGPSRGRLIAMGVALGLAVSTKYTGLLLALPVILAWTAGLRPPRRPGAVAASAFVLALSVATAFLAGSPMFLVEPWRAIDGFFEQGVYAASGHDGIAIDPWAEWWTYYVRTGLIPGLTWPVFLLALAGLVLLWRAPRGWPIVVSVVWVYLVLEQAPAKPAPFAARYLMPIAPLVAVAAGAALRRAYDWLAARVRPAAALAAVVAAFVAPPAVASAAIAREARADTRLTAGAWMDANIPDGATIGTAESALNLPVSGGWHTRWRVVDLTRPGPADPAYAFLVLTSFEYQRYFDHPDAAPARTAFFRSLLDGAELVQEFQPRWRSYGKHSPVIQIRRAAGAATAGTAPEPPAAARNPERPFGWIDAPAAGARLAGPVEWRGWALWHGGIREVRAFVDGRFWRRMPLNEPRPDVSRAYPWIARGWDRHGWRLEADLPQWVTPGPHVVRFEAVARTGAARDLAAITVTVAR